MTKKTFLQLREDFPMLKRTMHGKPLVYLDTAATAQKPQQVIDAISNFYTNNYGTVHRAIYELSVYATENYETTRRKAQRLLNAADPCEIVFTRGTTDGINLIAHSFGKAFLKPGNVVIISAMEHHSNIVPWQLACEERGAILKVIPMDDQGNLLLEEYAKLLDENVKIVAFAHVANSTGTVHPIKQMIAMAHRYGAKVLIDGAQSAPHMPVDVQELDADFYAFSGHKLYGPTGIGVLYGKKELLNALPPHDGGGDMVNSVHFEKTTYNELPLKFEAGTPMIAEVIGLGAAIDYINAVGLSSIADYEQELLKHATAKLAEIKDLQILGTAPEKGPILMFSVKDIHALDLGTLLDLRGIAIRTGNHCAQPTMRHFGCTATCRASFAFYNTMEEVDLFVAALKDAIRKIVA